MIFDYYFNIVFIFKTLIAFKNKHQKCSKVIDVQWKANESNDKYILKVKWIYNIYHNKDFFFFTIYFVQSYKIFHLHFFFFWDNNYNIIGVKLHN